MQPLRNVLVAWDYAVCAEKALPYALILARHEQARLHVLHVYPEREVQGPMPLRHAVAAAAAQALGPDGRPLGLEGVDLVPVVRPGAAPAPVLLTYARAHDVDLIVMGTHGRGNVGHLLLGSVAEEVVRRAPCPVLTVGRAGAYTPPATLVVPVDFTPASAAALGTAVALATRLGAAVHVLHVADGHLRPVFFDTGLFALYNDVEPADAAAAHARLEAFYEAVAGPAGPPAHMAVRAGAVADAVAHYATEQPAALLVMATHGQRGLRQAVLGSTTAQVIRTARTPVLTVPAGAPEAPPPGDEGGEAEPRSTPAGSTAK